MAKFKQDQLLEEMLSRSTAMTRAATVLVEGLSSEQWNFKPSPAAWSMAQVIEHLTLTNGPYLEGAIARLSQSGNPSSTGDFRSGWLGELFYRRLQPGDGGRIKPAPAPGFLRPSESTINPAAAWQKFLDQQAQLEAVIRQAAGVNLNLVKIPSAISKLLKFPLGDVLRIVVAHNDRHLLQMQRIKRALNENEAR